MPQDAACPKCKASFPVTEARNAFTVACPKCDTEMTVEFKKPTVQPEAGQPHYDLFVKPGALASGAAPPPPKKKKDDDDDDEPKRKGGSVAIVLLSGGFGLLFVLGGLGLTAWFLFFFVDTSTDVAANNNRPNNNQPNNNQPNNNQPNNPNKGNPNKGNPNKGNPGPGPGPGPGPIIPPKPRDEFELKPVSGSLQAITPPPLDLSTSQVINLPAPAGAVSVGGNGRYIVMHIPSKNQLICFDASQGKTFIGGEPTNGGNHLLAAGQNRLVAIGPNNIMSVYDLPSLQRRYDTSAPRLTFGVASIAMGSATNGPMLACDVHGNAALMDIGANGANVVDGSQGNIGGHMTTPVRAAPNGKLFLRGEFGNGSKTVLVTESVRKWKTISSEVCNAYAAPDGRHVLGHGMIVYSNTGGIAGNRAGGPGNGIWYVPGVSGNHFLRLAETKESGKQAVSISVHKSYTNPEKEKAVSLGVLPETEGLVEWFFGKTVPLDQHLFLVPEAKMLVVLNAKKDKLTMRKVDIK